MRGKGLGRFVAGGGSHSESRFVFKFFMNINGAGAERRAGGAGGEGEEGARSTGERDAVQRDDAEIAGDVDAFDLDSLDEASLDLLKEVDAGHEADAEASDDEALEELGGVKLHGDASSSLILDEQVVEELAAATFLGDEEAVFGGVRQRDRFELRERMAGGDDENQFVFVDDFNVEAGIADGERDDAELDLAVENERDGFGALGADDVEGDTRVLLFELGDEQRKDVERSGVVGGDGEGAAGHALHILQGEADVLELDERLLGEGPEDAAGGSKGDFAAATVEEAMTEVGFEGADLRGDGGLGDVQPLGGAGEALLSSDLKKRVEPVEVHRYLWEAALSAAIFYLNRDKMFCSFCPSRGD